MGVIQSAGAIAPKDRAKTVPTLRCVATGVANNPATSITITIPATAQAGDFAVFIISGASTTCSTPDGLTKVHVSQDGDATSQPYIHIFTRRLAAGDVSSDQGVSFTFTYGSNDGAVGGVQVFANTSGFGVWPLTDSRAQTEVVNNQPLLAPTIYMGPSDLYAGAAAVLSYLASGTANVLLTSPPAGATTSYNAAATRSSGEGGTCRGLAAWTAPSHAPQAETPTYPTNVWISYAVFTLAPVGPHTVDTQQGPAQLLGKEVYHYSNSSGSVVPYDQTVVARGCNSYMPWPERVARAFGPVNPHLADGTPRVNNMALGGALAADICAAAFGTATYNSVRSGADNGTGVPRQANVQPVTLTALPDRLNALFTTDTIGNDALTMGHPYEADGTTPTQAHKGARNAITALYKLIRAQAIHGRGSGGQTADASFADATGTGFLGGVVSRSTTPGATITIPVTDTPAVDVVLIAHDSTALGITSAPYAIKLDGATVATGTTHNEMKATGRYNDYKYVQKVISVTGIPAGAHTITIEHTGPAGARLDYQGHLIPATTPPWIVACCMWNIVDTAWVSWGGYATGAAGRASRTAWNAMIRTIVDSFTDGRVISYDPTDTGLWDPTVHVSAGDKLHHSERGIAFVTKEILRRLTERIPTPQATVTTPASLMPTTVPATITMIGTRDFTVTSGNQTFAIECVGGAGAGGGGKAGLQGRGGGGGAYAKKNTFTFSVGSVLRVTVGVGGAGVPEAVGNPGVASQVVYLSGPDFAAGTVLCKADFGTGGDFGKAVPGPVGQGGLAANCVGDVKTSGSNGSGSTGGAGAAPLGGAGGAITGGAITAGNAPGGGGSGGIAGTGPGAAGARGVVKFS